MEPLTADQLTALPSDARAWVILDTSNPKNYLTFPMNLDYDQAVFAFLDKEDAEHMVRLLQKYEPAQDKQLGIADDLLTDSGSVEHKIPLVVLDHKKCN
jgi:hypothetical protein